MGFQLSYLIEGEIQLNRNLLILSERVKDWTPAFKQTAEMLKSVFESDVFQSEGAVIEERWSPLKKGYALQKAKKHPGKSVLEATGAMRGGFMTLWRPDMAAVWNKVEYFKYHQSNQPRSSNLPRRVMIKLANAQKVEVVRIFQKHFQQIVKT